METPNLNNYRTYTGVYSCIKNVKLILVAQHFGPNSGGEAIKAYYYAQYLKKNGANLTVITHDRSINELGAVASDFEFRLVRDNYLQKVMWKFWPLRFMIPLYFHIAVNRIIIQMTPPDKQTIIHYIAPISPVAPRFPPKNYRVIMGPLSGGIYYPKAFIYRRTITDLFREYNHGLSQIILGIVHGDKARAEKVLVSGHERTRKSLKLARCTDEQMINVMDSGVYEGIFNAPRAEQRGRNNMFLFSGRLVRDKGVDLAIRALCFSDPDIILSIYGDGPERYNLEALCRSLNLGGRVKFHGWVDHEVLLKSYHAHRGLIFPSLAEANGIVVQEAMMAGLPVVAVRWGGPSKLADDSSAIFIDPISESKVIKEIALAMRRLANDPELAERLSKSARIRAEAFFTWDKVAESWAQAY